MAETKHLTMAVLEAGLDTIRQSPKNEGLLEMIVRRPRVDAREVMETGKIDLAEGLVGDSWKSRGSSKTPDHSPLLDAQLTLMNTRVISLLAQEKDRWQLAGDQLFVDMDLSIDNLPSGTQLALGSAIIEITALPHTGCQKFTTRFGKDAMEFVNSSPGRQLRLRGANARVIQPGTIRVGDRARKI